jgi:hypothetical protein
MKILYDLRSDPESAIVDDANAQLARFRPSYIERYGAIASEQWWRLYESHRISRSEHVGQVVFVGHRQDGFDEASDVVRIQTDRRDIEYDREGFWCDSVVCVGSWVHVEQVKASMQTKTGPLMSIIEVRIWTEDAV